MMKHLADANTTGYDWIDIIDPGEEELEKIAGQYGLHASSVADCLQPGHLPKYERFKGYTFVILRIYYPDKNKEADTVQEITNKIAIFISKEFIITIHRRHWQPIERINEERVKNGECKSTIHILNELVIWALRSYDVPGDELTRDIDYFEQQVFLTQRKVAMLRGLYFIKRRLDVIRRLLFLTYDIIDKIDPPETSNAYTRDIRDLYVKQKSQYDSLSENANHLLNIYFNISGQRTNETMRVLTIFSVFFMPLTFIVGVYGMNFEHMPELHWKYGYPATMALMVVVIVAIYIWFKKKKWL